MQAAKREGDLTAAERQTLLDRLQAMYAGGQIEILEGEQTFTLASEWAGGWQWGGPMPMKLIFRLDYDIPAHVCQLENKYVFYTFETFPEEDHHDE